MDRLMRHGYSPAMDLRPYLDDLERRLDERMEDELLSRWAEFLEGRVQDDVFVPSRGYRSEPGIKWPEIPINDAIADTSYNLMILREMKTCSDRLAQGSGAVHNMRANYGSCILPSLFGAELFFMSRELDTLPTNRPLSTKQINAAVKGELAPDPARGFGPAVFEMAEKFRETVRRHPRIDRYVLLYHPDLQSPMDACELLWGSDLFLAVYDRPDDVKALLRRLTDAYSLFMRKWYRAFPASGPYVAHWGLLIKGRIMLRSDSAMNFSPEAYRKLIMPFDRELLGLFGGGAVHFCGRGSHYIPDMASIPGLTAVNLSQPECNDMETIFKYTVDQGILLVGLSAAAVDAARRAGRALHGRANHVA